MADATESVEDATEPIHPADGATPRPSRRRWILWLAAAIVVFLILLFAYYKYASGKHPVSGATEDKPHVTVSLARKGDLGQYLEALGNVTPVATVNLYSQITGQVVAVHYQEGQIVHRGDPLIDIDPNPYEYASGQPHSSACS